jgi:ABC-type Fe3+-hydroxamate transport system substrate-binding protein
MQEFTKNDQLQEINQVRSKKVVMLPTQNKSFDTQGDEFNIFRTNPTNLDYSTGKNMENVRYILPT